MPFLSNRLSYMDMFLVPLGRESNQLSRDTNNSYFYFLTHKVLLGMLACVQN